MIGLMVWLVVQFARICRAASYLLTFAVDLDGLLDVAARPDDQHLSYLTILTRILYDP